MARRQKEETMEHLAAAALVASESRRGRSAMTSFRCGCAETVPIVGSPAPD